MYKVILKTEDGDRLLHSQLGLDAVDQLINPTIEYKLNSVNLFKFTIRKEHSLFDAIIPFHSIIQVLDMETDLPVYVGRLIISEPHLTSEGDSIKECTCEDEFAYLNDSNQRFKDYRGWSARACLNDMLNQHNMIIGQKQIYLGTCEFNDTVKFMTNYEPTMKYVLEEFVDKFGGELRLRYVDGKRYLDYLRDGGKISNQPIILGRNILDMTMKIDYTGICNKFIPLGAEIEGKKEDTKDKEVTVKPRVRIHYLNPGFTEYKDYLYDYDGVAVMGEIFGTKIYDDVTDPKILLAKALEDWKTMNRPARTIDLNALDFRRLGYTQYQSWELGDKVRILCDELGVDEYFKIVAMNFPIDHPENTDYTFGTKYGTMTSIQYDSAKSMEVIQRNLNEAGNIRADKLNGSVDMLATQMTASLYDVAQKHEELAILFEDKRQAEPTYGAMALGTKGFMISNEQYTDGSWNWKTFGTGQGFTADLIRAGTLLSKDGTLRIDLGGGTFRTYKGDNPAIELYRQTIDFYDWVKPGEKTGTVFSSKLGDTDITGIDMAHYTNKYMSLDYYNAATDTYKAYIHFDKFNTTPTSYYQPITINENTNMEGSLFWYNGKSPIGQIYGSSQLNIGYMGETSQINLGRAWGNTFESNVSIVNHRTTASGAGFISWEKSSFHKMVTCFEGLNVVGSKNCLQSTEHYGDRLINAYETMGYYFGDVGSGVTDETGICYCEIEDKITELLNTDIPYQVTTQPYTEVNKPLAVIKRTPTYFIVKGEPNIEFGWELKGKRRGYESVRAELKEDQDRLQELNSYVDFEKNEPSDIEGTLFASQNIENKLLGGI